MKDLKKWEEQEKAVTLTNGEWSTLTTYLLMSTQYREREAKAWAELAEEREKDGSVKYPNAGSNAQFWRETIEALEEIRKKMHSRFSIYDDGLIEIWQYNGDTRTRAVCKIKEEDEVDCYKRAIEALENFEKDRSNKT